MKFKSLIALIFMAALSGCATPKYNYMPETRRISEPQIGVATIAQVGEEMARQGTATEHDAIRVTAPIKVGAFSAYTIMPGYFKKTGEDKKLEYYMPFSGNDSGTVSKNFASDPWKSIAASKSQNKIGIITVFNLNILVDADGISWTKKNFTAEDSFQQTLIYSGKVGNKIRLGYREFSSNVARPAYNNDVEYDLNESSTVGYKGARIEILEATNEFIRYKLLQNFKQSD